MSARSAELAPEFLSAPDRDWLSRASGLSPALVVPGGVLAVLLLACFIGPLVLPLADPLQGSLGDLNLPPGTPGHPLGTDALGRDLLARSLYGGRVSFVVGVGAAAIGMLFGGGLGIVAGYSRGSLDGVIMRVLDVLLAFPGLVLALGIAAYLGASLGNEILAVSFFMVPACARVGRAATLGVRGHDFVASARLSGAGHGFVLLRHVLPNVSAPLLTFGLLQVGTAMIIEAGLSFLGLGVKPPQPSWGNMIASGQQYLSVAPWIALVPGAFLAVTIAAINTLGEAVRSRRDET
jgi:peptide/nickel transport system permease protein